LSKKSNNKGAMLLWRVIRWIFKNYNFWRLDLCGLEGSIQFLLDFFNQQFSWIVFFIVINYDVRFIVTGLSTTVFTYYGTLQTGLSTTAGLSAAFSALTGNVGQDWLWSWISGRCNRNKSFTVLYPSPVQRVFQLAHPCLNLVIGAEDMVHSCILCGWQLWKI